MTAPVSKGSIRTNSNFNGTGQTAVSNGLSKHSRTASTGELMPMLVVGTIILVNDATNSDRMGQVHDRSDQIASNHMTILASQMSDKQIPSSFRSVF